VGGTGRGGKGRRDLGGLGSEVEGVEGGVGEGKWGEGVG